MEADGKRDKVDLNEIISRYEDVLVHHTAPLQAHNCNAKDKLKSDPIKSELLIISVWISSSFKSVYSSNLIQLLKYQANFSQYKKYCRYFTLHSTPSLKKFGISFRMF